MLSILWHEGILFKLKTYGVNGEVLTLRTNYLHERYQRVVLNGQISSWELAKSGVPQGSILGALFFVIYINDLPDNLESNCKIFADDTSLFYEFFDKHISCATLNKDLELISNCAFFNERCSLIQIEISKLKNYIFLKKLVTKNR